MEKTGRKIPITAAKAIANNYGYTQVIIHAFDGETGIQSVATFGKHLMIVKMLPKAVML
jgi:hypothetical protein